MSAPAPPRTKRSSKKRRRAAPGFGDLPTGPRRVAVYLRRSTDDEHQPFSISAQEASLGSYVASQPGWTLTATFTDDASGATTDRPGLQQALRAARAGRFDVLRHPRLPSRTPPRRCPRHRYPASAHRLLHQPHPRRPDQRGRQRRPGPPPRQPRRPPRRAHRDPHPDQAETSRPRPLLHRVRKRHPRRPDNRPPPHQAPRRDHPAHHPRRRTHRLPRPRTHPAGPRRDRTASGIPGRRRHHRRTHRTQSRH
jgi:resolvase-like protein